ncbi:hypothetical protein AVEN_184827-1 [Araneus ventricosus]|uniref:RING-type domain-containing protein n=1 Tax=Araneus ventricosus TaxID=182803 RepID=A0A4Y2J3S2_ARAVE|nr:hypothetical protein AVEN_184827-1 [Araneus ventricosus]
MLQDLTRSMAGQLTALDGRKDCWKIQISPSRTDSDAEDTEGGQATPQYVLDSLSRYTVRKNGAYSRSNDVCGLCHCKYSIGNRVVCLPCQHNFHEYCIENWLKWVKSTCPVDKKSVVRKECLKQVESERYRMKVQRLVLKGKTTNIFPKEVTRQIEAPEGTKDEPVPSPAPAVKDRRRAAPPGQADPESRELRATVTSPFRKHSSTKNRCKGSRMEEVVKPAEEPSTPRSRTGKQNPTPRSPTTPKSTKSAKNSPQKFNYLDFLKSLDTPWTRPIVVTSYRPARRHSPKEKATFSDYANAAKQRCSRINKRGLSIDCERQKPFQRITSRKCSTSASLRYSKERKGGWIYKNDVNLSLKRSGLYRKPKTA